MFTLILCWLIIFVSLSVLGKIFSKKSDWFQSFWIGCAIVFSFLQIWSLFLPVNFISTIFIFLFAGALFYFLKIKINFDLKFVMIAFFALLITTYFASRPVGLDDTLLYHLNAVKWANSYKVVPGLGNLHTRLGFNSSFFLYTAFLDNWIMKDKSSHFALFSLASTLILEILWILTRSTNRILKIFCMIIFILIIKNVIKDGLLSSLSPDFAVTIFSLALAIEYLRSDKISSLVVYLLALLLVTIKLNVLVFAFSFLIISTYTLIKTKRKSIKLLLSIAFLILVPYFVRNYVLTGWLIYPIPILGFGVDWQVPRDALTSLSIVVSTWAKHPGTEWAVFIGAPFWKWFPGWFSSNKFKPEVIAFFFSLSLLLVKLISGAATPNFLKINRRLIYLEIIAFMSIIFVFITVPDIRFAAPFVWIFSSTIFIQYLNLFDWTKNVKYLTILLVLFISFIVCWPASFDSEIMAFSVRWEKAWPTENVGGILKPTDNDLCGNSALPCSPENNNIIFRSRGNLSKGFAPLRN